MQDVRSLIHQTHTENWEELDRSGMNLTELPPEIERSKIKEIDSIQPKVVLQRSGMSYSYSNVTTQR